MKAYKCGISKKEFIKELKIHQQLDNFIKGTYELDGKGCAVGCSLMSVSKLKGIELQINKHIEYENHLGIPEWLAKLEDIIFENMSDKRSKTWPIEFAQAINTGSDLNKIKSKFIIYILNQNIDNQKSLMEKFPKLSNIFKQIIKVNKLAIKFQDSAARSAAWSVAQSAWSAAWSVAQSAESARSAARSAAWSADSAVRSAAQSADSAAWSAVRSAAQSADSAARSADLAARSAAQSADSAAWSAAIEKYADKLLKLMRDI